MKKIKWLVLGFSLAVCPPRVFAATLPLSLDFGSVKLILPFQKVEGTQLYSFAEGKGFPAVETTVSAFKKLDFTLGAAPVLGTSFNVPFVGVQAKLPSRFFDTSNNEIKFGAFLGRASSDAALKKRTVWGLKASIPLW